MSLTTGLALGAVLATRFATRLALAVLSAAFGALGATAFSPFAVSVRCFGAVGTPLGAQGPALGAHAAELSLLGLGEGSEDRRSQLGLGRDAGGAAGGGGKGSELFSVGAALGPGLVGYGADFSSLGRRQTEAPGHPADVAHLAAVTPAGSSFSPLVLTVSLCSLSSTGATALAVACTGFPRFFGGPPVFDGFGNLSAV